MKTLSRLRDAYRKVREMKYFRLTRSVVLGTALILAAVYMLQPRLPGKGTLTDFEPELVAQGDKPQVLDWKQLRELNVKTNQASPKLKAADGKVVRIAGFMVPLEDQADNVTEFLLVPYPQACIHVPAPPPNQIVHVKMAGGKKANMVWWEPIWAQGKLKIIRTPNIYTESSFQLSGIKTEPYQDDYDAPY